MKDERFIVGLGEVLWDKLQKNGKPVRGGFPFGIGLPYLF